MARYLVAVIVKENNEFSKRPEYLKHHHGQV